MLEVTKPQPALKAEEPTKTVAEEEKPVVEKIAPETGRGIYTTEREMSSILSIFFTSNFMTADVDYVTTYLCVCTVVVDWIVSPNWVPTV